MERKQESALGRAIKRSLDMKWGFREIRLIQGGTGWSKEAQALIDKYDELLALRDRIKPRVEQKSLELQTRFDDLEAKMQSL